MSGSLSVVSFEGELNAIVQEVLQLIIHQIKLVTLKITKHRLFFSSYYIIYMSFC